MREIISFIFIIICTGFVTAQNNVIIQQNTNNTIVHSDEIRINGIPMSADIGGVDISQIQIEGTPMYFVSLTNYNDFIVNVVFQFSYGHESDKIFTGTMVLKPNESKETSRYYFRPNQFMSITRKLSH